MRRVSRTVALVGWLALAACVSCGKSGAPDQKSTSNTAPGNRDIDSTPLPAQAPAAHGSGAKAQDMQKIQPLGPGDQQRLREQRAVVEKYLANEESKQKYKTAAGKLGTIRGLLAAKAFDKSQTYELQCLGIVLGDAFVQELGMEWVMVSDEHGRDPAVRRPGTSILLFPLTMISKRVERGEDVDVFDLFNGLAAEVESLSASPEAD